MLRIAYGIIEVTIIGIAYRVVIVVVAYLTSVYEYHHLSKLSFREFRHLERPSRVKKPYNRFSGSREGLLYCTYRYCSIDSN